MREICREPVAEREFPDWILGFDAVAPVEAARLLGEPSAQAANRGGRCHGNTPGRAAAGERIEHFIHSRLARAKCRSLAAHSGRTSKSSMVDSSPSNFTKPARNVVTLLTVWRHNLENETMITFLKWTALVLLHALTIFLIPSYVPQSRQAHDDYGKTFRKWLRIP